MALYVRHGPTAFMVQKRRQTRLLKAVEGALAGKAAT